MTYTHLVHEQMKTFAIVIVAVVIVLALASPSQAEIVYTPVDITIKSGTFNLDANSDGVTDFTLYWVTQGSCVPGDHEYEFFYESPASGNASIVGPLKYGTEIGPNQTFNSDPAYLLEIVLGWQAHGGCAGGFSGPWTGKSWKRGEYLGLSFQVNGQTCYGWARFSIVPPVTLLGYAYENVPGRTIRAGRTSGK